MTIRNDDLVPFGRVVWGTQESEGELQEVRAERDRLLDLLSKVDLERSELNQQIMVRVQ